MKEQILEVELDNLSRKDFISSARLRVLFPGNSYVDLEIVGELSEANETLPIIFSGAVSNRSTKIGPFFSGKNLLSLLQVPGIMIADPSLDLDDDLNLGWYAGNSSQPRLAEQITKILTQVAKIYQVEFLLIGGSGGGFASLIIGDLLGDLASVFVWNPQTDILRYNKNAVERYFGAAFSEEGDLKEIEQRIRNGGTITSVLDHKVRARRVLYVQNVDDWHTQAHSKPFVQLNNLHWKGRGRYANEEQVELWLAEWGKGHAAPPVENIVKTVQKLLTSNTLVSSAFLNGFWQFPLPSHDQLNTVTATENLCPGDVVARVTLSEGGTSGVIAQSFLDINVLKMIDVENPAFQPTGVLKDAYIPVGQSDRIYLLLSGLLADGTEVRGFLRGGRLFYEGV